jgi:hypothetical protein
VATVGIGCAEKTLMPDADRPARFSLQLRAATSVTKEPQQLFIAAVYKSSVLDEETDSFRLLDTVHTAVTNTTQQINLKIDLTECLADGTRLGSRDACSMYILALLQPAGTEDVEFGEALDVVVIGAFDVVPGRVPVIPTIDLTTSRYAVSRWASDEALQLGGGNGPSFFSSPISGAVSGNGAVIFVGTNGFVQDAPSSGGSGTGGGQNYAQLAILQGGAWRRVKAPQANIQFNAVAAVSPTDVYIGASDGLYHYDGTAITAVSSVREPLFSVAISSASSGPRQVIAGTNAGNVWIGSGATFARSSTGTSQLLDGVCINDASNAFASNRANGSVFRFDGSTWVSAPVPGSPTGSKSDLQCVGARDAYIASGSTLQRWTGSSWSPMPSLGTLNRGLFFAVVSASEIYAAGDSSNTNRAFYRFDGSSWREVGRLSVASGIFQRPWADPSGGAFVASSSNNNPRIERVTANGAAVVSYRPSLRDVVMPTSTSAFVVGTSAFLSRWNGSRWTVDAPPTGSPSNVTLQGVWADGPANGWAVGGASVVWRWDGARWNVISDARRPAGPADNYNGVWGTSGSVWVVGDASILRCRTLTSCSIDPAPGGGALYGVWGSSATNVFAVGAGGRILRYDGSAWSAMTSATQARLTRVWGSGPSDVWAIGDSVLVHYDGSSWKSETRNLYKLGQQGGQFDGSFNPPFQMGLWGPSAKEVFFGTWTGRFNRHTEFWGEMTAPNNGGRILSIAGAPEGCPAIAIIDANNGSSTAALMRGVGPTGCFATPMTGPTSWP